MEIKTFVNPEVQSNSYVITVNDDIYVVDPGGNDMTNLIEYLKEKKLNLKAILLTHGHFDHIIGIPQMLEYKKVPIYVSERGYDFLYNPELSLSVWIGQKFVLSDDAEVIKVKEGDKVFNFEIIETPGHSIGDICYFDSDEKILISGDTMFRGTYGRTDLPTSSEMFLWKSLRKLLKMDEDIKVYPGHGLPTTIGEERKNYR